MGIEREWDLLVERREHLDRECIAALTGEGVLGSMSRLSGGGAGGNPFAGLSAIDMLVLARTDRRTLERLSTSDPAAVQEWWAGLGEDQQDALVSAMPGFIGALNGVPALSRVAANRLLAAEQLRKIRSQRSFADVDGARRCGRSSEPETTSSGIWNASSPVRCSCICGSRRTAL